MQRRFSTFPDGWPGCGLLLLRLTLSLPLLYWAIGDQVKGAGSLMLVLDWLAAAGGLFILAGLWTATAGVLVALIELWTAAFEHSAPQAHVLIAALAASLVMLGPGAFSVDARRFGRKVFKVGDEDV